MKCIHNKSFCSLCFNVQGEKTTIRVFHSDIHVEVKQTHHTPTLNTKCFQGTPRLGKHKRHIGGIRIK